MTTLLRRGCYVAGVLVAATALATGRALAAPAWHDGDAGAPSTVVFSSVAGFRTATGDDVVVAVGRDTALNQAVVYRLVGGTWRQDPISGFINGVDYDSCLTSVSVTPVAAWAVGWQGGGCGGTPAASAKALIVRFPHDLATRGLTATDNAWQIVNLSDPSNPGSPLPPLNSVSLSGTKGYVSTTTGAIYRVSDDGSAPTAVTFSQPSASAVNGVVAYGTDGLAVGDSSPSGVHIFQLNDTQGQAAAPATSSFAGIAALSPAEAIAIVSGSCTGDATSPCYWVPAGGAWTPEPSAAFGAATQLNAASIVSTGSSLTEAVAGEAGGSGAVWTRTGTSPLLWSRMTPSSNALNGVTALGQYDIWAVGDGGTVLHYVYDPDPIPPPTGGSSPPSSGSGGGSSVPPQRSGTSQQPLPAPHVTIDQPKPKPGHGHKGHRKRPQRLLTKVHVKVLRGRLIVTFRLSARARVTLEGRTGRRVVAAARTQVLAKGRRRMVLRYRGSRPPAQLRIVARPAAKPKHSCRKGRRRCG